MAVLMKSRVVLTLLCALWAACETGDDKEMIEAAVCVTDADFFSDVVYSQVLNLHCVGCHNPQGIGRTSEFVLKNSALPGYMEANQAMLTDLARLERDGESILLLKPINEIRHGGGMVLEKDSEPYRQLKEFIQRVDQPTQCKSNETNEDTVLEQVELSDPLKTLRRASLLLVGRMPKPDEIRRVELGQVGALRLVLHEMMAEDNFFVWLREVFNDKLLTDRYLGGNNASELLDAETFPNRYWYEGFEDRQYRNRTRSCTQLGIARAPLELMLEIVREDRPFGEILTADTMMVNACSARSLGLEDLFPNAPESYPRELFVETQLPNRPHIGILSTHAWLHRFPTTATNRNRHRSRIFYEHFLATDILALDARPIDQASSNIHNPTMNDPQCSVCHANVDPVAGLFKNWDLRARYLPPELGWHGDMRQPGLGEEKTLPGDRSHDSLRWLAEQTVTDIRFELSMSRWMLEALTGRPALKPSESDARHQAAYELEDRLLKAAGLKFREGQQNIKSLLSAIILSPLYRAEAVLPSDEAPHALGSARLLTPRQLDRRIRAVTGYNWRWYYSGSSALTTTYRMLYGGIDSNGVTKRINQPNGLMAAIARRMANGQPCNAVARDFVLRAEDRRLFPLVESTFEPETIDGFVIEEATERIRANIRYLHEHVLGERLSMNDPEIDHTYQLFYDVWKEGRQAVENGDEPETLYGVCRGTTNFETREPIPEDRRVTHDRNYTLRAWSAVLTYLLSDYRFLYD